MTTLIRVTTLTGYFRVAHRHGLDPLGLLREAKIDAASLGKADYRIPVSSACWLLDTSAARAGCPTFGLEMAELRNKDDAGPVGILLAHQRTLREALYAIVQYRSLLNDALGLHIETGGELVTLREEIIADVPGKTQQAMELAIGILTKICRGLLGQRWKPRSVHFTHAAPADRRFHRAFFDCPVTFGSDFNGIVCAAVDLDVPNPMADPELVRYAETLTRPLNQSQTGLLTLEVRKAIYLLLPMEQAAVDQVARKLNLSSRTLQRQLAAAGTDFSTLLSDVRHELAMRYLANVRYPIGRIAALLGFSRQASFTRWFIGRCGMTPRTWRTNHKNGGGKEAEVVIQ
ncbi:AraC family transcriptional regulator [Pseudoduganella sp. OTU4001]|uniref:AraC family transcriptional regulator n=1 Tax=Pseudoduganella sp. OTU4001 TaxID=3043854 RepID=UPI00313D295F